APAAPTEAWPAAFKKQSVDYVIIYSPDPRGLALALQRFYVLPDQFTLVSLDGHTVVFAWNKDADAQVRQRHQRLKFDLTDLAFGPNAAQAPRSRPGRAPAKHEWYTALWEAPPARRQIGRAHV